VSTKYLICVLIQGNPGDLVTDSYKKMITQSLCY